jgi:drug/metabolite transporter (DMT)-like permease
MTWLFITIFAYFLYAINSAIDKRLLSKPLPNPAVYSFYVGILSIFALIFIPFGFIWPGFPQLIISLLVGSVFLFTLFVFFQTLKKDEVSRVVPIIGGITPIFVFILSYLFLGERLSWNQALAFLFLVSGGILLSIRRNEIFGAEQKKYSLQKFGMPILTAFLFGIFYVSIKFVFLHQPFISGFIWTRIGSFLTAFLLLIPSKNRKLIFKTTKNLEIKTGALIIFNKTLAGLAFILLNYAIYLGSVTLVNALQGIQYVFLLILIVFMSKASFLILNEKINKFVIIQKVFAILLIGIGLIILSLHS